MVVVAILGAIAWTYRKFLAEKIKSEQWSGMILRAGLSMKSIVVEVNQVYVNALRAADDDNVITDEEKAEAKKMAIAKFKEQWGVEGLKELAKIIGVGDALDSWLETLLESTVAEVNAAASPKP